MSIAKAPKTARVTGWDRAVVITLGGAGCALSYDALQQMAVAIHVRGFLTYLFPLVIDGFIAYGVRALLVLRDAPLRARLYVWTLFGTATAASIWANALHAVRLNEEHATATGLRLGDTVVAVLSTIAPLALAGAVHLYILIARGPVKVTGRSDRQRFGQAGHLEQGGQPERVPVTRTDRAGHPDSKDGQVTGQEPVGALTDRPHLSPDEGHSGSGSLIGTGDQDGADRSDPGHTAGSNTGPDLPGQSDTALAVDGRPAGSEPVSRHPVTTKPVTDRPVTRKPVNDQSTRATADRRPDPDTERLLEIARSAVRAEDKLTRKVVAQAIRGQQIPLSNDTLTALMVQLRNQHGQSVTSPQG